MYVCVCALKHKRAMNLLQNNVETEQVKRALNVVNAVNILGETLIEMNYN